MEQQKKVGFKIDLVKIVTMMKNMIILINLY
jgi:hypothetical protein